MREVPRLAALGDYDAPEPPPRTRYTKRPRELGHSVQNILVLFREIDVAIKKLR
jgi:hypothetical protein